MIVLASDQAHRIKLRHWQDRWRMPYYIQESIPGVGRDIGVTVLGTKVLGAFYRVSTGKTLLTLSSAGGHYETCLITPQIKRLALAATACFDLNFTVVAMVETDQGYLIYEVSAFGGFSGLWRTVQASVADRYVDYILRDLARRVVE